VENNPQTKELLHLHGFGMRRTDDHDLRFRTFNNHFNSCYYLQQVSSI